MAKQPELVRSSDGELRVDASFPNGRYTFSLRSGAADLVRDLGYRPGEALPWDLFQTLAVVGDVWLPNTNGDIADDPSVPDTPTWMDDGKATAVADYLTGRHVSAADRERLAALLESSALGDCFSVDELDSNAEWVDRTASLVSDADASASTDRGAAESATADRASDASLLHVGKVTLGRQNMGRAARAEITATRSPGPSTPPSTGGSTPSSRRDGCSGPGRRTARRSPTCRPNSSDYRTSRSRSISSAGRKSARSGRLW